MKNAEIHITSYFSLETDLASTFSEWPEFIEGEGYNVKLSSAADGIVTISLCEESEDEGGNPYISVASPNNSALFQRALGLIIYLLSGHSDNLMVQKWS